MDRQEIFNAVYLGLKSQEFRQSTDPEGMCQYRGNYGRKCAAGWLIPDDKYDQAIEGYDVASVWVGTNGIPSSLSDVIDEEDIPFVNDLQILHDDCEDPRLMKERLNKFAKSHNLSIPQGE